MVNLKDLLKSWGFTEHPFDAYSAEKEARLTDYFVHPPYLGDVLGSATTAAPALVFGDRGIGKSALRIYVENLCASGDPGNQLDGKVIAITYDDFSAAQMSSAAGPSLEAHVEAILQKMTCAALGRISVLLDGSITSWEAITNRLPALDHKLFAGIISRHFSPLSASQQERAFQGVYEYFKGQATPLADRLNWFQRLWSTLRTPLLDIANVFLSVNGKAIVSASAGATLGAASGSATSGLDRQSIIDDFRALAGMAKQFEIDAWYVLIDKVDEDEKTNGDAAKSARLIAPLLQNLKILETERVSFKFFLWDQLRPILKESNVRFDKIKNWTMTWTESELQEMINRRLAAFSNQAIKSLSAICDAPAAAGIYGLVITHAKNSPREIVQILDSIFREHARHSTTENSAKITLDSIDRGLDDYCKRRASDLYPAEVIKQISKLPGYIFKNSDVQAAFKIAQPTASQKIGKWVDNGYVKKIDDTRSQKDPSKLVFQYAVTDPRLRRILERRLVEVSSTAEDDE